MEAARFMHKVHLNFKIIWYTIASMEEIKRPRRKLNVRNCLILAVGCMAVLGIIVGIVSMITRTVTQTQRNDEIAATAYVEKNTEKRIIMIDPGHGGYDDGAVANDGTLEKTINLAVSLKVKAILEEYPIEVLMTRESDEVSWPSDNVADLQSRLDILSDSPAEFMISIHCNSSDEDPQNVFGLEVYVNEQQPTSLSLAETLNDSLMMIDNIMLNRGVKDGSMLHLLALNDKPVIIIESGFMTHDIDASQLNDEAFQKDLAYCIAQGILNYLGI